MNRSADLSCSLLIRFPSRAEPSLPGADPRVRVVFRKAVFPGTVPEPFQYRRSPRPILKPACRVLALCWGEASECGEALRGRRLSDA